MPRTIERARVLAPPLAILLALAGCSETSPGDPPAGLSAGAPARPSGKYHWLESLIFKNVLTEPVSALEQRGADVGQVYFSRCAFGRTHLCAQSSTIERRPNGEIWRWRCVNSEGVDESEMLCELRDIEHDRQPAG